VWARKAGSMTAMRDEIIEQPAVVARLTADLRPFEEAAREARAAGVRFALYAARGTSDNAAVYGKYLATILAGVPAGLATPSAATLYGARPDFRDCLVIGISQSGETPDVADYLAAARAGGAFTVAITNDAASPLAASAHHVLATGAGAELAVAATKTYTSQLAALAAFWAAWLGDRTLTAALAAEVPLAMEAALEVEDAVRALAARLSHAERLIVAGRGFNYATALETALKLEETCYLAAMPFSAADLRHGPIAMVEPRYPVLLFAPDGATLNGMVELRDELRRRGAETWIILNAGAAAAAGDEGSLILSRPLPEALSPLAAVVPGQLLALHLSLARGLDPDRPRGLSKVTRTR
jgi:glucosamine--fructose-6-phosphate aminotransferase (isomerizing)